MIRTSKHTIKFANRKKQNQLETVVRDYKIALQECVDLILNKELPLKRIISTKDIPILNGISHSHWKLIIYQDASSMVRSKIARVKNKTFKRYQYLYAKSLKQNKHSHFLNKRYSELNINFLKRIGKIEIKNVRINLDHTLFNIKETDSKEFDEFVKIRLPYMYKKKSREVSQTVNIPIKYHKQSNKFKNNNWIRKNTVGFDGKNLMFYWEKEEKPKTKRNKSVGIDIGYKKLISTSNDNHFGKELVNVYESLARKKVGSINFKQTLIERDKLINQYCNEFYRKEDFDILFIENLKKVKFKTKQDKRINSKFMNKLQRWSYSKTIDKLEMLSEEKGFHLTKVNPAYTSQRCSKCGVVSKSNRQKEIYSCACGMRMDADTNAALNILHRGVYNPSVTRGQEIEL